MNIGPMQQYLPAILTAMGAISTFPAPPQIIKQLGQNKVVQYLFLFVLIMQGGGGLDVKKSAFVALLFFLAIEGMNMMAAKGMMMA